MSIPVHNFLMYRTDPMLYPLPQTHLDGLQGCNSAPNTSGGKL